MFELTGQYYRNKCNQCRLSDAQKRRKKIKEAVKINIVSKLCINCKNTLNIEMFNKDSSSKDGHDKVCRQCYKITRHKTKKEVNTTISEQQCVKCKTIKNVNEFRTTVRSNTGYFKTCNSCWKPREWNKEKQKKSERKYIANNPDRIRLKNKRQSQAPHRRIKSRIQNRIKDALNRFNLKKKHKSIEYLGCDLKFFNQWIEFQFNNKINWDNMKDWHIDHVIPCSEFDLSLKEDQLNCFNWKNLRPCLAIENLEKSNKIIPSIIKRHQIMVSKFLQVNPLPTQIGDNIEGAE